MEKVLGNTTDVLRVKPLSKDDTAQDAKIETHYTIKL